MRLFSDDERRLARDLLRLSFPIMIGVMLAVGLNVINAVYISMIGEESLIAVAFAFPVMLGLSHAFIGLGTGVTSQCAALLGAGQTEEAGAAAFQSVFMAALLGLMVAVIGVATAEPFFRFMGAKDAQLAVLLPFVRLWYGFSVPALAVMTSAGAALRSTGDTKTPAKVLAAVALLNGALDPILIFGYGGVPALGAKGAAVASGISLGLGALAACVVLRMRYGRPSRLGARFVANLKLILFVGFPSVLSQLLPGAAQAIVTFFLARVASEAVAGYGVASRTETLFMVPFMGLSAACTLMAARMRGASENNRLRLLSVTAVKVSLCIGGALGVLLACMAPFIAKHTAPSVASAEVAVHYLWIAPLTLLAVGGTMCASAVMNAILKPYSALYVYALRCAVLLLPAAAFASRWGAEGVFAASAVVNAATLPAAWLLLKGALPAAVAPDASVLLDAAPAPEDVRRVA